mgnify:CR=1 FL=1
MHGDLHDHGWPQWALGHYTPQSGDGQASWQRRGLEPRFAPRPPRRLDRTDRDLVDLGNVVEDHAGHREPRREDVATGAPDELCRVRRRRLAHGTGEDEPVRHAARNSGNGDLPAADGVGGCGARRQGHPEV